MPRIYHTPKWIRKCFNSMTWDQAVDEPVVYLTFDDGPDPVTTPWLMDCLSHYRACGTFFCVGANGVAYPQLLETLRNNGHRAGNHTHHHLNGWQCDTNAYIEDVRKCGEVVPGSLFRPPYGKIRPKQARKLKQLGYHIVMWSILSYDFDASLNPYKALEHCLKRVGPGSIVLFHDNAKAFENLKVMLPPFLDRLQMAGFRFETLEAKQLCG